MIVFIVQVNDNDGILNELTHIGTDKFKAEQIFLDTCSECFSDWNEYSSEDVSMILDEGHAEFRGGVVVLIDTSNCVTDDELRDALTGQPGGDIQIAQIVSDGELALTKGMTVEQILELCGDNLNAACSWEIQGQVLFKGSDGEWYTITTESMIGRAAPEFVKDVLEVNKESENV